MKRTAAAPIAIMLVLAAGCGGGSKTKSTSSPTTAAAPTTLAASVPAGYTGFTAAADHFTISVPSSWRQIDPSSPGANQTVQDLVKTNPGFASVLGSGDLASKGMKYFAADATTGSSVNMVVKPAIGARDSDLNGLVDELKKQYTSIGATVTGTRSVPLAGHTALQVSLDLKIPASASTKATTVHETQDLVAANDLVYILTLAGDSPALPAIAETLRV